MLRQLSRNAKDQQWISHLWIDLDRRIKDVKQRERNREINVVGDFRLLRFSLPEKSLGQIQSIFEDLLHGGEEIERDAW